MTGGRILLAVTLLSLGAAPASAQRRILEGMAAFFMYGTCPNGWRPVESASGRLILGTAKNVGTAQGTPFAKGEARPHAHSFDMSVTLPNKDVAGLHGCCNERGSKKGGYESEGVVKDATANLPFVQYPLCEPVPRGGGGGRPTGTWPLSAVSFFTGDTCPDGWTFYARAEGRFVVPTVSRDDRVGKVYGTAIQDALAPHGHGLSAEFTTQRVDYALAEKFPGLTNKNVAKHSTYTLKGSTTTESVDLPYLRLNICRVDDDARTRARIPSGLMLFVGAQRCDTEAGWEDAPGTKGRYLVALPARGETGLAFGGDALHDGELRTHTHPFDGKVTLSTYKIVGAAGCCAKWYAGKGTYTFSGTTAPGRVELPYVALRQCVRR